MQNDIIITNKMLNELHEFLSAAQILLPEGAKCGGSIREIRYKSVFCAQPKIRIIREIRGRKKFRSIRSIRCSKCTAEPTVHGDETPDLE